MRVAVVGSRSITAYAQVAAILDAVFDKQDTVVSGDCPYGVDAHAKRWAKENGVDYLGFPAEWVVNGKLNRGAGFDRNHDIVAESHCGLAIWDGKSRGTKHTIGLFAAAGKECGVHTIEMESNGNPNLADLFE